MCKVKLDYVSFLFNFFVSVLRKKKVGRKKHAGVFFPRLVVLKNAGLRSPRLVVEEERGSS